MHLIGLHSLHQLVLVDLVAGQQEVHHLELQQLLEHLALVAVAEEEETTALQVATVALASLFSSIQKQFHHLHTQQILGSLDPLVPGLHHQASLMSIIS